MVCRLEDVGVISFLHEELVKVMPAIQNAVKGGVRGVSQRTATVSAPETCLVEAFSFHLYLLANIRIKPD